MVAKGYPGRDDVPSSSSREAWILDTRQSLLATGSAGCRLPGILQWRSDIVRSVYSGASAGALHPTSFVTGM